MASTVVTAVTMSSISSDPEVHAFADRYSMFTRYKVDIYCIPFLI